MKPIDILIIILAIGMVVGTIVYSLWKKKQGKGGCGCGCNGCPSASFCASAKNAQQNGQNQQIEIIQQVFTAGILI